MTALTTTRLTFTPAERAILAGFAAAYGYHVETCTDDGDEWAALMPAWVDRFSISDPHAAALSVQLTDEPGRRFVAVRADGRETGKAGDGLARVLAAVGEAHG